MKKRIGVVHAMAECQTCDWRNENHKNAQATAAKHAKFHKHIVHVEVALAVYYDGTEE